MRQSHASFSLFFIWLAYALLAPLIIVSWYVLLTFDPHDSYWFYDTSLATHSLLHPINLVGALVYFFGAGAWIIMIGLTHALFRFTKHTHVETALPETVFQKTVFIDYGAGYLFFMMGFSGLCASSAFDPLIAAAPGGLFGEQLHAVMSMFTSTMVEQYGFQVLMFWGACFTVGFGWAHYVVVACTFVLYPFLMITRGVWLLKLRLHTLISKAIAPMFQTFATPVISESNDLEMDVYEITRNKLSECEFK